MTGFFAAVVRDSRRRGVLAAPGLLGGVEAGEVGGGLPFEASPPGPLSLTGEGEGFQEGLAPAPLAVYSAVLPAPKGEGERFREGPGGRTVPESVSLSPSPVRERGPGGEASKGEPPARSSSPWSPRSGSEPPPVETPRGASLRRARPPRETPHGETPHGASLQGEVVGVRYEAAESFPAPTAAPLAVDSAILPAPEGEGEGFREGPGGRARPPRETPHGETPHGASLQGEAISVRDGAAAPVQATPMPAPPHPLAPSPEGEGERENLVRTEPRTLPTAIDLGVAAVAPPVAAAAEPAGPSVQIGVVEVVVAAPAVEKRAAAAAPASPSNLASRRYLRSL
jgi:hypothetical protein